MLPVLLRVMVSEEVILVSGARVAERVTTGAAMERVLVVEARLIPVAEGVGDLSDEEIVVGGEGGEGLDGDGDFEGFAGGDGEVFREVVDSLKGGGVVENGDVDAGGAGGGDVAVVGDEEGDGAFGFGSADKG